MILFVLLIHLFIYFLQSSPEETDVEDMIMEEASSPERSSDYAYANHVQVTDCLILILFDSFISLLIYLFSLLSTVLFCGN